MRQILIGHRHVRKLARIYFGSSYRSSLDMNCIAICKHGDNSFALVKRRRTTAYSPSIWADRDITARRGYDIDYSNHRQYRSRIGGFKTLLGRALRDWVQALFAFRRTYIHDNSAITLSGTVFSSAHPLPQIPLLPSRRATVPILPYNNRQPVTVA